MQSGRRWLYRGNQNGNHGANLCPVRTGERVPRPRTGLRTLMVTAHFGAREEGARSAARNSVFTCYTRCYSLACYVSSVWAAVSFYGPQKLGYPWIPAWIPATSKG